VDEGQGGAMSTLADTLAWLTDPANWWGPQGIAVRVWQHIQYSAWATLAAIVIALPLGLLIGHTGRGVFVGVNAGNLARAVPTLGVVILVNKVSPLSVWPVVAALTVLALPSILANTVAGIRGVEADVRDAATGMGMSGPQVLFRVELPIALPLVLAGMRTAANQVIATATVAAFVGLGGLGRFIRDGYAGRRYDQIYGGAVLVILLVFAVEGLFALLQRRLVSPGVSGRSRSPLRAAIGPLPPPAATVPHPTGGTTT
jgi:osmoprotectant transport system permease protein